jgi:hypothetical protein
MFRVASVDGAAARSGGYSSADGLPAAATSFPRKARSSARKSTPASGASTSQLKNADGGAVDGTDARSLSGGEVEGRRQALDYLAFCASVFRLEAAYPLGSRRSSASARRVGSTASTY